VKGHQPSVAGGAGRKLDLARTFFLLGGRRKPLFFLTIQKKSKILDGEKRRHSNNPQRGILKPKSREFTQRGIGAKRSTPAVPFPNTRPYATPPAVSLPAA